jgi:hypothetical protein
VVSLAWTLGAFGASFPVWFNRSGRTAPSAPRSLCGFIGLDARRLRRLVTVWSHWSGRSAPSAPRCLCGLIGLDARRLRRLVACVVSLAWTLGAFGASPRSLIFRRVLWTGRWARRLRRLRAPSAPRSLIFRRVLWTGRWARRLRRLVPLFLGVCFGLDAELGAFGASFPYF